MLKVIDRVEFTALAVCAYCGVLMGQVRFSWLRRDYEHAAAESSDGVIRTHGICPRCAERELAAIRPAHGGPRSVPVA